MLIQDFVQIEWPYSAVRGLLEDQPIAVLAGSAHRAYREGEVLSLKMSNSPERGRMAKDVALDVGRPHEKRDGIVIPVCWWATKATWLFPCLDGDIVIAPVGVERTQIMIMASYEPPLVSASRELDAIVLRRAVESTVRSFLSLVATHVAELLREPPALAIPIGA
jgi:hypothetical protein